MRRFLVTVGTVLALGGVSATGAFAATTGNTGQPNQSCQSAFPTGPLTPFGFNTAGFNHATSVYAATTGTHSAVANNSHPVSQYDVACFEASQHP
jgi:hypothetical protein